MHDEQTRHEEEIVVERAGVPRLVHLADMRELRVADGDPDIRGWDVRTADGEKVGSVRDLVVDTQLMKVRYIEARIDREVLNTGSDRHVLIPIGSARLDDSKDDVYLNAAIVDPRSLPPYDRALLLSRDYEVSLLERFPTLADSPTTDFYGDSRYDDRGFFGERRRGREDRSYLSARDGGDRRRP